MGQQAAIIIIYERSPTRIGHLGDSGVATWPILGDCVTHPKGSNTVPVRDSAASTPWDTDADTPTGAPGPESGSGLGDA
jgi:hypothetical protein